jgi:hypothetical protein
MSTHNNFTPTPFRSKLRRHNFSFVLEKIQRERERERERGHTGSFALHFVVVATLLLAGFCAFFPSAAKIPGSKADIIITALELVSMVRFCPVCPILCLICDIPRLDFG